MKTAKFILIISVLVSFTIIGQPNQSLPSTVTNVDLKRYSGLWYEIAKIPNWFQDHCAYGTTAEYRIDEDGDIAVINKCYDDDGEADIAEGVAKVVDKKTNSKLEVSFVSFLGIRLFWGDYWIIGLDENYNWAVVGTPNRKYGWILSRSVSLSGETLEIINGILLDNGYKPESFKMTDQSK